MTIFDLTIFFATGAIWAHLALGPQVKDLFTIAISTESALLGFYFGTKGSSTAGNPIFVQLFISLNSAKMWQVLPARLIPLARGCGNAGRSGTTVTATTS